MYFCIFFSKLSLRGKRKCGEKGSNSNHWKFKLITELIKYLIYVNLWSQYHLKYRVATEKMKGLKNHIIIYFEECCFFSHIIYIYTEKIN